jgi:hypothetical protein
MLQVKESLDCGKKNSVKNFGIAGKRYKGTCVAAVIDEKILGLTTERYIALLAPSRTFFDFLHFEALFRRASIYLTVPP